MKSPQEVSAIIGRLKELYPDAACSLDYDKDYELLFSVRLAAQCTDARVNQVTPALFARFPTLEAFAAASQEEVGEYVRSCGFWRAKARDIVAAAKILLSDYGGRVPDNMEELLRLPGVGRKTANLILGDVYGQAATSATPTASASPGGWALPTAAGIRCRWSSSCAGASRRRSPAISATGWCFMAGPCAWPEGPTAAAAPCGTCAILGRRRRLYKYRLKKLAARRQPIFYASAQNHAAQARKPRQATTPTNRVTMTR